VCCEDSEPGLAQRAVTISNCSMSDAHQQRGTVILVTNDGMGHAPPELRHKLIRVYVQMLLENESLPQVICFYGDGVKLVVSGSPVEELLVQLENKGVVLISCATCLNHFSLAEKVVVGVIGGMHDIVAAQFHADKVITL
jgi:hypothetical protein